MEHFLSPDVCLGKLIWHHQQITQTSDKFYYTNAQTTLEAGILGGARRFNCLHFLSILPRGLPPARRGPADCQHLPGLNRPRPILKA